MIIQEKESYEQKFIQDYLARPISKEIFEKLSHIINSAANQERCLLSFAFAVQVKLDLSDINEVYKKNIDRKFLALMWVKFKKEGYCVRPKNLSDIERNISINTV